MIAMLHQQVHPIFALAVTDLLLSIMWIIGGIAWLRRLEKRVLCFVISVPTVVRTIQDRFSASSLHA